MNRSDLQKIIDEIIGEAALALLMNSGPVSSGALINQLRAMENQAEEQDRRQYIALAIKEITQCMAEAQRGKSENNADNVAHLYPGGYGSGSQRKH